MIFRRPRPAGPGPRPCWRQPCRDWPWQARQCHLLAGFGVSITCWRRCDSWPCSGGFDRKEIDANPFSRGSGDFGGHLLNIGSFRAERWFPNNRWLLEMKRLNSWLFGANEQAPGHSNAGVFFLDLVLNPRPVNLWRKHNANIGHWRA